MAGKWQVRNGSLFNETTVKLGEAFTEYLTIGVDPISFRPTVRVCNTDGSTTSHISIDGKHFATFLFHLSTKLESDEWSIESSDYSGVEKVIADDICHLKTEYGKVEISREAAEKLTHNKKALEIIGMVKRYIYDYQQYKPALRKYQQMVYQKYIGNTAQHLKTYFTNLGKETCSEFTFYPNI